MEGPIAWRREVDARASLRASSPSSCTDDDDDNDDDASAVPPSRTATPDATTAGNITATPTESGPVSDRLNATATVAAAEAAEVMWRNGVTGTTPPTLEAVSVRRDEAMSAAYPSRS